MDSIADFLTRIRNANARQKDRIDVPLSNMKSEIARILKPGGTALISDFRHTKEYARALHQAGLTVTRSRPYLLDTFPPLRIVQAVKPGAGAGA